MHSFAQHPISSALSALAFDQELTALFANILTEFGSCDRGPKSCHDRISKQRNGDSGPLLPARARAQPRLSTHAPRELGLSGLPRWSASRGWSARPDIDCLGGLYGFRGLLDREIQYALVEMRVDGSVLRLEWQGHRSVE